MLPGCHERTGHGEGTPGEEIAFPSQLLIPFEGLSGTSSRYLSAPTRELCRFSGESSSPSSQMLEFAYERTRFGIW
jgi:hypothetical protein